MILEVVRALAEWLNDGTNGLGAKLASLDFDGSDTAPTVGTIADETQNDLVGQGHFPTIPGVAIQLQEIADIEPEVTMAYRDAKATVLIRVGRSSADTRNAKRDTSYILRAGMRSLRLFNAAVRTRNQVEIYSCERLHCGLLWAPTEDVIVTGAIVGTWWLRDCLP